MFHSESYLSDLTALTGSHLLMFPCSPNMPQAGNQTHIFGGHLRHYSNIQVVFAIFFKAVVFNMGSFTS